MTQTLPFSVTAPSHNLLALLRQELLAHMPFSQMPLADVEAFLAASQQRYFAPDQVVAEPSDGPVKHVLFIRRGAVTGTKGLAVLQGGAFQFEAGDMFPLSAAVARRAVSATYRATGDVFALAVPVAAVHELALACPPFADFLNRRVLNFLAQSRRALQVAYASQTLAEQSLEAPLSQVFKRAPITCTPDATVGDVLRTMHAKRIGSILVVDAQHVPVGIITRYDVLGRIALPQVPLEAKVTTVMVGPVHSLTDTHTAQDAALLMSQRGIRHVPVTNAGKLVGVVSERDLFALQRLSLKQVSTSIRAAQDVETLQLVAQDIRRFARSLIGQGVQARQLTALISHLNDVLAEQLVHIKAAEHGVSLERICWLALGSEGRSEQTIATDQDNAIVLADNTSPAEREQVLRFAADVNQALDACGYPLCKGGIMAGQQSCCMTLGQWRERLSDWVEHGAPEDLLAANIYFDFRALAGQTEWAGLLRREVQTSARRNPRFLKQLALNALNKSPPLNWLGALDTRADGTLDLKLQGTTLFVDAARLLALQHDVPHTNTRERLVGAGRVLGLEESEYDAWASAFEFLQLLRLRVQLGESADANEPNSIAVSSLNDIDRRILKESFRMARSLQQRLQLDFDR